MTISTVPAAAAALDEASVDAAVGPPVAASLVAALDPAGELADAELPAVDADAEVAAELAEPAVGVELPQADATSARPTAAAKAGTRRWLETTVMT